MTTEEIDALPGGRELDALIAEKVMNLSLIGHPNYTGDWSIDRTYAHLWKGLDGRLLIPFYSTDIAAAWEILAEIAARPDIDQHLFAEYLESEVAETYFDARFIFGLKPVHFCRAALKVVST